MRPPFAAAGGTAVALANLTLAKTAVTQATHPYAGMWVAAGEHVRQRLSLNGRCDKARGSHRSAWPRQSIAEAASAQDLVLGLECPDFDDEGKISWPDCLATLLQVGLAVGLCWVVNLVAA